MAGGTVFEILTLRGGSWSIEATAASQQEAQLEAGRMLNRPFIDGVRIVKESKKSIAQLEPADILFEKVKQKTEGKVFVQQILDAPLCASTEDLYGWPARSTINQLMRTYLDKANITATELMHSAKEIKRLLDEGTLINSAAAKVASLQAKKTDGNTNARRDELYEFIRDINARVKTATERKLPRVREVGFNGLLQIIGESYAGADADFMARVAVTTELIDNRNLFGKLATLLEWATEVEDDAAFQVIDVFISDILWNTDVLRELLGSQRDLGSALVTLICFASGEPIDDGIPEDLNPEHPKFINFTLNRFIAEGRLPDSQSVLFDRVKRQLEGVNPLSRGDREEEREVFSGLLNKLIPDVEMVGGPSIAEAVTQRQSMIINKGGQKGLKEAAASMLPSLADPGRKAGYLLALLECALGQELLREDIDQHLEKILVAPPTVNHIVRDKLPPNLKMRKITSIYYRIEQSSLPDDQKDKLKTRLDDLLTSYLIDGKLLEKLDNPERPLHIRARMLVSMVQPEMLPNGRASSLAREIIIKHLRRPNFEKEMVAQIPDPGEKATVLRQFHEQLNRCGFFG